jgi:hypothetical protein
MSAKYWLLLSEATGEPYGARLAASEPTSTGFPNGYAKWVEVARVAQSIQVGSPAESQGRAPEAGSETPGSIPGAVTPQAVAPPQVNAAAGTESSMPDGGRDNQAGRQAPEVMSPLSPAAQVSSKDCPHGSTREACGYCEMQEDHDRLCTHAGCRAPVQAQTVEQKTLDHLDCGCKIFGGEASCSHGNKWKLVPDAWFRSAQRDAGKWHEKYTTLAYGTPAATDGDCQRSRCQTAEKHLARTLEIAQGYQRALDEILRRFPVGSEDPIACIAGGALAHPPLDVARPVHKTDDDNPSGAIRKARQGVEGPCQRCPPRPRRGSMNEPSGLCPFCNGDGYYLPMDPECRCQTTPGMTVGKIWDMWRAERSSDDTAKGDK